MKTKLVTICLAFITINAFSQITVTDNDIVDVDHFHRYLVFPTVLKMVDCKRGKRILDVACGNGILSRRLAAQGGVVVGIDVSEVFIGQAIKKSDDSIDYHVVDATSKARLLETSSSGKFDVIVCSMALHDLPTITPLLEALPTLLQDDGCFV